MTDSLARLVNRLGYRFQDMALLEQALTHRSANRRHNNERLEFLGDAQLGQIIGHWLFERFPEASEGQLTRMRAALVCGQTLADVARELELGECIRLGGGEMKSGGHRRESILADAMEAVIGALRLDGGPDACRERVLGWYGPRLDSVSPVDTGKDAKTRLQEWLQGRQHPLPVYDVVGISGQPPKQTFRVACRLPVWDHETVATGSSRRRAEQIAAEEALIWLEGRQSERDESES